MKPKLLAIFCVLVLTLSLLTLVGAKPATSTASAATLSFPRGMVSITFDDNYRSQFTNAVPYLDLKGIKATFYTVTFDINNEPDYMLDTDLQAIWAGGHEIGSHTVTHPNLTMLDPISLDNELKNSKSALEGLGLGPITDFACPEGAFNDTTTAATKLYYASQREGYGSGINTGVDFDPYQIHAGIVTTGTDVALLTQALNQAITDKSWIVLIYHEVSDTPGDPFYATTPAAFQAQIDAIKASGIACLTVQQALNEIMPPAQYTVNASVDGGHGTALPASQTINAGGSATINLAPDSGYQVASITDNTTAVPAPYGATYTINNVNETHNVVVTFSAIPPASFAVTSISPNSASQNGFWVFMTITGSGFQPGSTLQFEKGATVMQPLSMGVDSDTQISCTLWLLANEAGAYDVVVTRPDSQQARLTGGFTVQSQCGQGSGTGILMLGMALGLLSLGGSIRLRRNRRMR